MSTTLAKTAEETHWTEQQRWIFSVNKKKSLTQLKYFAHEKALRDVGQGFGHRGKQPWQRIPSCSRCHKLGNHEVLVAYLFLRATDGEKNVCLPVAASRTIKSLVPSGKSTPAGSELSTADPVSKHSSVECLLLPECALGASLLQLAA